MCPQSASFTACNAVDLPLPLGPTSMTKFVRSSASMPAWILEVIALM